MDLGEPPHHHHTATGCQPQQAACPGGCGLHGHCVGGLHQPTCRCAAGWVGTTCLVPTWPATLAPASFMKLSLSFTPMPHEVTFSVKVKANGAPTGLLLWLAGQPPSLALILHVSTHSWHYAGPPYIILTNIIYMIVHLEIIDSSHLFCISVPCRLRSSMLVCLV